MGGERAHDAGGVRVNVAFGILDGPDATGIAWIQALQLGDEVLLGLHVCWVSRVERAVIEVGGILRDLFSGQLYGVVSKLPEAVPGVCKWVVWVGVYGDRVVSLCVYVHKFQI